MKQIESKGLPDMTNWRFITLTIDPKIYPDPCAVYVEATKHLRRFRSRLAKLLDVDPSGVKWAWKLEFQRNGYPHWHLLYEYKDKLTYEELQLLDELWKFGSTNVKRVEDETFYYLFKYMLKPAHKVGLENDDEDRDELTRFAPGWFLDHYQIVKVIVEYDTPDGAHVSEPHYERQTFARARFWQTSKGFYTGISPKVEKKERVSCQIPYTVRQKVERILTLAQLRARDHHGRFKKSKVVQLEGQFKEVFPKLKSLILRGKACSFQEGLLVEINELDKHSNLITKWQIQQLKQHHRLNLRLQAIQNLKDSMPS